MMEELHSQRKTIEDIVNCLNRVPLHPQIVSAIKSAHAQGDANQFFIETISKNHGVYDCFSEIITNLTVVDKEGRLRIFPYHGSEVQDGGGDFCSTLKLAKEDHVIPRKDFPLHNLVLKFSVPIKPEVHEWSDGDELNKILLRLIGTLRA
ncbi:thiamine phosphate phosphatase-like protein [Tanacetum coccineum]